MSKKIYQFVETTENRYEDFVVEQYNKIALTPLEVETHYYIQHQELTAGSQLIAFALILKEDPSHSQWFILKEVDF